MVPEARGVDPQHLVNSKDLMGEALCMFINWPEALPLRPPYSLNFQLGGQGYPGQTGSLTRHGVPSHTPSLGPRGEKGWGVNWVGGVGQVHSHLSCSETSGSRKVSAHPPGHVPTSQRVTGPQHPRPYYTQGP